MPLLTRAELVDLAMWVAEEISDEHWSYIDAESMLDEWADEADVEVGA